MILSANLFQRGEARLVGLRLPISKIALLLMDVYPRNGSLNSARALFFHNVLNQDWK